MKEFMERVHAVRPLIHCITNYVTVNDCANILLACGASPIMADAPEEAGEITNICSGLVLNIGTLNERTVKAMFAAGRRAKELHHSITLDPVGAGASTFRTETAKSLLTDIRPDILRCNISELKMLLHSGSVSRGVDAADIDRITEENLPSVVNRIRSFAKEYQVITAVSGAIDVLASPDGRACAVFGGSPIMADITGSGCMLTALTEAYAAANPDRMFEAVSTAFGLMKGAGAAAAAKLLPGEGNATFRIRLIDAVYCAEPDKMKDLVKYEMF